VKEAAVDSLGAPLPALAGGPSEGSRHYASANGVPGGLPTGVLMTLPVKTNGVRQPLPVRLKQVTGQPRVGLKNARTAAAPAMGVPLAGSVLGALPGKTGGLPVNVTSLPVNPATLPVNGASLPVTPGVPPVGTSALPVTPGVSPGARTQSAAPVKAPEIPAVSKVTGLGGVKQDTLPKLPVHAHVHAPKVDTVTDAVEEKAAGPLGGEVAPMAADETLTGSGDTGWSWVLGAAGALMALSGALSLTRRLRPGRR
jgi:hypothetical protein